MERKQSGETMVTRDPRVLLVTKGGGDMGWGKLTFQGFRESSGCPVGLGPGLEGLEWVRQKLSGARERWVLESVHLGVPGCSSCDSQMGPLLQGLGQRGSQPPLCPNLPSSSLGVLPCPTSPLSLRPIHGVFPDTLHPCTQAGLRLGSTQCSHGRKTEASQGLLNRACDFYTPPSHPRGAAPPQDRDKETQKPRGCQRHPPCP